MTSSQLKCWRARLKLSQSEAAKVLGCSKMSIVNWEGGRKIPDYIAWACTAIALDLKKWGDFAIPSGTLQG